MTPSPTASAPKRKQSAALIVVLVLAIPLGLLVLLGGAGVILAKSAKPLPVTDQDRQAVVTAADLVPHMKNLAPGPSHEKVVKKRQWNGGRELNYEYKALDAEKPLFLNTVIHAESSSSDARNMYMGVSIGLKAGLALERKSKVELEDHDELLKWGDESKAGYFVMGGKPIGNFFITRKGSRVFSLILSGVYFKDPEAFHELVMPKLEGLELYDP